MKRTFPINLDGKIFYIDEDAYNLLRSYLDQLHLTFKGCEGDEIVADIESRIREHFDERMRGGAGVITLNDINKLIETMGRPEELGGENEDAGEAAPPPFISINLPTHKRLYRNMSNKVFGGVIGGLAVFLNWQPNILRLVTVILTILLTPLITFWPLPLIYLIAWMIIPPAVTPAQLLEMNGTPRNIDTLGQAVIASQVTPPPYNGETKDTLTTVFSILGKTIMAVFGILAALTCLGCLSCLFAVMAGIFTNSLYGDLTILNNLDLAGLGLEVYAILGATLMGAIIAGAIAYGAASVVFHLKSFSKGAIITLLILVAVLFILTAVFGILALTA